MSTSDVEDAELAVTDAYIALPDYVVEFPKEVSDYFVSKLGEEDSRRYAISPVRRLRSVCG